MNAISKIEWTERTWNPITGCTKVSLGCKNCYAEREWRRLSANKKTVYYEREFTDIRFHQDRINEPLKWKKPCRVFVNSMSDLFHEQIDDLRIASVFSMMRLANQHQYQILTKRPERMQRIVEALTDLVGGVPESLLPSNCDIRPGANVWLGISAEDQATANERIPHLLNTQASIRFLSLEPLLGPITLHKEWRRLDWVIVGGESGPNSRPMYTDWVISLRDQCRSAHIPFFFKQWGEFNTLGQRVGKRNAGRLLDGREWNQYPAAAVVRLRDSTPKI